MNAILKQIEQYEVQQILALKPHVPLAHAKALAENKQKLIDKLATMQSSPKKKRRLRLWRKLKHMFYK